MIKKHQLTLLQQKILNPRTNFLDRKKAGVEFIQILRGNVYMPSDEQIMMILDLMTEYSEVGLEEIMLISDAFQQQQKDSQANETKRLIRKKSNTKISFGSTIKADGLSKARLTVFGSNEQLETIMNSEIGN